jgi:ABC-type multidrug transport system ATPase subunit
VQLYLSKTIVPHCGQKVGYSLAHARHGLILTRGAGKSTTIRHLMGELNEKYEGIKSVSLFSLYEPAVIVKEDVNVTAVVSIFLAVGIVGYVLSVYVFNKKIYLYNTAKAFRTTEGFLFIDILT